MHHQSSAEFWILKETKKQEEKVTKMIKNNTLYPLQSGIVFTSTYHIIMLIIPMHNAMLEPIELDCASLRWYLAFN